MSLAFYMDHHVPSGIVAGLRGRQVDVVTAQEDGASRLHDEDLLQRSTQLGRVLFSQDRHLLGIAQRWIDDGKTFGGLVYAHQLNISIGKAVEDLHLIAEVLGPEEMLNRVEFIPF